MSTLLALSLLAHLPAPAIAAEAQVTRRFALVAGSNDGGGERVELRYADTDAQAVVDVLEELGGVEPGDTWLLTDVDRAELEFGFQEIKGRIKAAEAAGERTELMVYYSGHSDEEGLLPSGELYDYKALRDTLEDIPADVRLLVLDSCSSGAMVRQKGGVMRAPFLVDESVAVSGHAYLTSSSADESAQESDNIGGSFFTHYFVSGLRGAADTSSDGRVTLNEAYYFAYTETLARTERTRHGPQHAAYDIKLNGTGDLVMTDLSQTRAGLLLGTGVSGRVFVRDAEGKLVAELNKTSDREIVLGLEAGSYTVLLDQDGALMEARVKIRAEEWRDVEELSFTSVDALATVARGDGDGLLEADEIVEWVRVPFSAALLPTISLGAQRAAQEVHTFALGVAGTRVDRLDGGALAMGAVVVDDDADGAIVSMGANIVGANADGALVTIGVNTVAEDLHGAAVSVGGNFVGGDARGSQLAVGANITGGDVRGFQGAAGVNITGGDLAGGQVSAGVNVAPADVRGIQAAAGGNLAGTSLHGAQFTAGVNITAGESKGAQLAAGVNLAENLQGAQLGIANVGAEVHGLQLGIVNVARDADVQVGLINISEDVDVSFGLLTLSKNGVHDLSFHVNEDNPANLELKLGGKHLYSLLGGGYRAMPGKDNTLTSDATTTGDQETTDAVSFGYEYGVNHRFTTTLGIGGRGHRGRFYMDGDLSVSNYTYTQTADYALLGRARVSMGYNVLDHVSVFAGGSANAAVYTWLADQTLDQVIDPMASKAYNLSFIEGDAPWWPGFVIGLSVN